MSVTPTTLDAYKLLHKGALALARVEQAGIRVDVPYLEEQITKVGASIKGLEEGLRKSDVYSVWRRLHGQSANLGSRVQLGKVLFDEMKYPCPRLTATRRPSTDDSTLATIDHPFVKDYLRCERLKKLRSTYLQGVLRETSDGFLHPSFNLHTVETFRSSSDTPNFQNLPIRDPELGPLIRRAFVPRKRRCLLEVDYGALEFKGAACFWKDPGMVAYASDPTQDIHRDTAARLFKCKRNQVSKVMRYNAKNLFVFPILYGSYHKKMAQNLWEIVDSTKLQDGETTVREHLATKGITERGDCDPKRDTRPGTFEHHVRKIEDDFNRRFPLFGQGKEAWWNAYRQEGGFDLMTGFRVEGVYSRNFLMNCPIQGPAFHLLLWSLIHLVHVLTRENLKTLVVGQIHDCILFDAPEDEVQDVLTITESVMTIFVRKAMPWVIVPLSVEVDVVMPGETWHDKKPWVNKDGRWQPK